MKKRTHIFWLLLLAVMLLSTCTAWAKTLVDCKSINLLVGGNTTIGVLDSSLTFTWKSSDKSVAVVGKKTGKVTAVSVGKCTITGKSSAGDVVKLSTRVYKSTANAAKATGIALIGHRGDTDRYPENSLLGVASTVKQGWDGAEVDLFYTDSGEFVCFHDRTLTRMCGSSLSIFSITKKNRKQYPLKSKSSSDEVSYIPLLEEVLSEMSKVDGTLYLHLKAAGNIDTAAVKKLANLIKKYKMTKNVVIFGYDTSALRKLAKKGFICGLFSEETTVSGAKKQIDICVKRGYKYFFAYRSWMINRKIVQYAHNRGIKAGLYKTLSKTQLLWLQDIGADFSMMYYRLA